MRSNLQRSPNRHPMFNQQLPWDAFRLGWGLEIGSLLRRSRDNEDDCSNAYGSQA
jgi:hypothetical protein